MTRRHRRVNAILIVKMHGPRGSFQMGIHYPLTAMTGDLVMPTEWQEVLHLDT